MPERAAQLAAPGRADLRERLARIRLLTTWTGGSCGIALGRLRASCPAATP